MVIHKSIRQAQIGKNQEKRLRAVFNDNTSSYENLMFKAKNGMSPFLSRFRDRTLTII